MRVCEDRKARASGIDGDAGTLNGWSCNRCYIYTRIKRKWEERMGIRVSERKRKKKKRERMADARSILVYNSVYNRSELSWVVLPNKLALGSKGPRLVSLLDACCVSQVWIGACSNRRRRWTWGNEEKKERKRIKKRKINHQTETQSIHPLPSSLHSHTYSLSLTVILIQFYPVAGNGKCAFVAIALWGLVTVSILFFYSFWYPVGRESAKDTRGPASPEGAIQLTNQGKKKWEKLLCVLERKLLAKSKLQTLLPLFFFSLPIHERICCSIRSRTFPPPLLLVS